MTKRRSWSTSSFCHSALIFSIPGPTCSGLAHLYMPPLTYKREGTCVAKGGEPWKVSRALPGRDLNSHGGISI
jgi:hypothetical protein